MKEPLILVGIGLVFVVCALGALVGLALTEPVRTLDGLTVLAACLLLAGVFSWFTFSMWKEAGAGSAKGKEAEKQPAPPAAPAGGEKTA